MLENRMKNQRRPNLFKSIMLVFLMVMSTTFATMIPSEWEDEEPKIDVEYRSMQSSPALQSMNQGGQGDYEGSTVFHSDDVHPALRDIMWSDVGVSSGIISDLSAVEALMHPATSSSRSQTATITTTMESVICMILMMTTTEFMI